MGKTNHQNPDAIRNVIRSHNTMLVSMPQEVSLRAGLQRGVQVLVGQDLDDPTTITMKVLNPADRKAELKAHLAEKKARAHQGDLTLLYFDASLLEIFSYQVPKVV